MPTNLYRRGAIWWLRVTIYGRERRFSLRTPDRKLAKSRAALELERLNRESWGDERHTWKAAVVRWGETAHATFKPRTLERYLLSLAVVGPVLEPLFLDEIGRKQIAAIAGRKGVTNATRRRDLTAVSSVLRACTGWGWLEHNPVRSFDRGLIRERQHVIVLPQQADVDRFVAACPDMLGRLVRLLEQTGLRLEEAGSLTWRQMDSARRCLTIEHNKSGRPRAVPLSDAALRTISGTPRRLGCPWVFWHGEARPDRFRNLDSPLAKIRKAAGIPFRTHDLRHLYAVREMQAGRSIYAVQQALGHTSVKTTEIYLAYLTPAEVERAKAGAAS